MILLQRPSVKLAYLLMKQFYLINSFGPSVYQPEHCKWLVTRIPDRTHHPHTSQCCQAWGDYHSWRAGSEGHTLEFPMWRVVVSITSTMTGPQASIKQKYLVYNIREVSCQFGLGKYREMINDSGCACYLVISYREAQSQIQSGISSARW